MDSRIASISEVCSDLATSHLFAKVVGLTIGAMLPLLLDQQLDELYFAAGFLVLADFITGMLVVWTIPGARIESRKFAKSIAKILIYTLVFISARQAEIITNNVLPIIDESALGYIGVHEFISILENAERMGYKWAHRLLNIMSFYKGPDKNWGLEHPKRK